MIFFPFSRKSVQSLATDELLATWLGMSMGISGDGKGGIRLYLVYHPEWKVLLWKASGSSEQGWEGAGKAGRVLGMFLQA